MKHRGLFPLMSFIIVTAIWIMSQRPNPPIILTPVEPERLEASVRLSEAEKADLLG